MAERFSEQSSNRRLIDFLKAILVRLGTHQMVGDEFTQERLAELGVEFDLTDSDWGQLFCKILDSQLEVALMRDGTDSTTSSRAPIRGAFLRD
jgi:hypothetical protein